MKSRALALTALAAALTFSAGAFAKNPGTGFTGVRGTPGTGGPEGTPTLIVNVPIGGLSTDNACGGAAAPGAGNTVVNVGLGAGAVVTGLGAVGGYESFSPSWRSEVRTVFRGANPAETILLSFSGDDSPGTVTFDFPPIDLTGASFPNITLGASGNLSIELCEDFADASVSPDATFAAGTTLRVACFNCFDPFAEPPVPAPTLNQWGLIVLLGMMTLIGGLAVRRFS
jgi:hypothetical protein